MERTTVPKLICLTISFMLYAGIVSAEVKQGLTPEIKVAFLKLFPSKLLSDLEHQLNAHLPYKTDEELSNWTYSSEGMFAELRFVEIQLDSSAKPEIILGWERNGYCGSGGCTGYVFKIDEGYPRYLGEVFPFGDAKVVSTESEFNTFSIFDKEYVWSSSDLTYEE